ncbi:chaplin [Streptomyces camelliae]|uniref:Chaplin n=1 Tax=Streptomyces camelliae TaxID=3004093 RepID=A0ABY7NXX5_9ACTN|nr:chaplin [Streptomyces sp. HUAS 2-6]WBO62119.1 chaplin [Streptomyces sp. HUAS 2-6]
MRLRSFATTAVLAGVLATGGSATAFAADPTPVVGVAGNSPGVVSGNVIQIPVDVDANVCGNSINLVGLLNPAPGNVCVNG